MDQVSNPCLVCLYRRDGFVDGPTFPIHEAVFAGVSLEFEGLADVCREHFLWIDLSFGWSMLPDRVGMNDRALVRI